MICFRLLDSKDPAQPLANAVHRLAKSEATENIYTVDPSSFRKVPNSPFAYWVSERLRSIFVNTSPLENKTRTARLGSGARDDFRYLRLSWEALTSGQHGYGQWVPFAKGGSFSRYYADIHLLVDWEPRRNTFLGFLGRPGRWISRPESVDMFFRPGLTWPRRTNGLSFRVMPSNCIFADKGPAVFLKEDNAVSIFALAAIVNSKSFGALVRVQLARTELAQSFEVGLIQQTPVPDLSPINIETFAMLAKLAWQNKRKPDTANLTSHAFICPALTPRSKHI